MKPNTRRSPREIIESVDQPELEEALYKLPGQEPVVCSTEREENRVYCEDASEENDHIHIHTHPGLANSDRYPSTRDLSNFYRNKKERTSVIAQTNPRSGVLKGYFALRKRKSFQFLSSGSGLVGMYGNLQDEFYYGRGSERHYGDVEHFELCMRSLFSDNGLQCRYFPNKYYSEKQEK